MIRRANSYAALLHHHVFVPSPSGVNYLPSQQAKSMTAPRRLPRTASPVLINPLKIIYYSFVL